MASRKIPHGSCCRPLASVSLTGERRRALLASSMQLCACRRVGQPVVLLGGHQRSGASLLPPALSLPLSHLPLSSSPWAALEGLWGAPRTCRGHSCVGPLLPGRAHVRLLRGSAPLPPRLDSSVAFSMSLPRSPPSLVLLPCMVPLTASVQFCRPHFSFFVFFLISLITF